MTEEEEYEWLLGSDGMFPCKKQSEKHLRDYECFSGTLNSVEHSGVTGSLTVKDTLLQLFICDKCFFIKDKKSLKNQNHSIAFNSHPTDN